mmetsp:Transcript_6809/g.10186  ORF Transcript_6809/g.10186 Transcript_6809/m.10186 type:complete len:90 (-) Transcript_6809:87-356(-)
MLIPRFGIPPRFCLEDEEDASELFSSQSHASSSSSSLSSSYFENSAIVRAGLAVALGVALETNVRVVAREVKQSADGTKLTAIHTVAAV